ncbi:MAG TPA: hypothetical protein VFJ58_12230 [Armatimonadota bacterium]|nr:hypothetical protein [Armatimonadota bacterium]
MSLRIAAEKIEQGRRLNERDAAALLASHNLAELGLLAEQARLAHNPEPLAAYAIGGSIPVASRGLSPRPSKMGESSPGSPPPPDNRGVFAPRSSKMGESAPGSPSGIGIRYDEIEDLARRLEGWGATDLALYGALDSEPVLSEWVALLAAIHAAGGVERPVWRLAAAEVERLAAQEELPLDTVIGRLRDAGLEMIAGEPVGPVPAVSPHPRLALHRAAHAAGIVSTAGPPEGASDAGGVIAHLAAIRELQESTGGFVAYVSGPVGRRGRGDVLVPDHSGGVPVSSFHYLRSLAAARCFLDNVAHVQAAWEAQGAKIGEVALRFGADDLGSTGICGLQAALPPSLLMPVNEMERLIRDSGFTPRLRDGRYKPISTERIAGRVSVWGSELRVVPQFGADSAPSES